MNKTQMSELSVTPAEDVTDTDVGKMPCEDAISRQAVWDVMQELWGTSGELIDRLMDLPSVTPEEDVTDTDVGEMPGEDAISRAELVRKLNTWDCNVNAIPNYVWKVIRELPSVTLAEKVVSRSETTNKWNAARE